MDRQPSDTQQLMTPAEVAEWLRVPVATLTEWRYRRRGGPPYVRLGRLIRYDRADVQAWIEERKERSPL